jgi:predicted anti-sigma-YlaC factor YlaD
VEIVQHATDDTLERYAMRTLPESACSTLEEHLLVCQSCRDRLQFTDEYVAAMKLAAEKIRESGTGE